MTPFAIAGMQLRLSGTRSNLPHIAARLDYLMAVFPWVQMVVLSELAAHGPNPAKAEPIPGPTERAFQEMAAKHGIWLLDGSIFELSEGNVYNTASVIAPDGKVVARYRKMFPFYPYEEGVLPGDRFTVFDVPEVGRFGVSICYDMWFPETSRSLAALGAEVILHPSLTATIDRGVELAIATSTAATNQCFVIDINGVEDGGNGHSIIVGPTGRVMHRAGSSEELMPIEIDLDRVRRSREFGLLGLGQPLKSFRDSTVRFPVYGDDAQARAYLEKLGPLARPERGTRVGLPPEGPAPAHRPRPRRCKGSRGKTSPGGTARPGASASHDPIVGDGT